MLKEVEYTDILSNKLRTGLILSAVLVALIMIGFFVGSRWAAQELLRLDSKPDKLTVDLEQKRVQLQEWGNGFSQ